MKKFLKDMISNPDGTFSTKRTAGWVCLWMSFGIAVVILGGWAKSTETASLTIFGGFLTGFLGIMGVSSYDARTWFNAQKTPTYSQPIQPSYPNPADRPEPSDITER